MTSLPSELEREIFEFSGYKLRNGKYMNQLEQPRLSELYILLLDKPPIVNGKVTIDLNYKKYHRDLVVKVIEINKRRRSYIKYHAVDYDDTRYEYNPSVLW
jgi:hypothetical protein